MASTKKKTTAQPSSAKSATATKATAQKAALSQSTEQEVDKSKTIEANIAEANAVEVNAKSTKTTMRKTASRRSPAISQDVVHSVVFTVKKQDKELLEAIEQELDTSEFANFDELCKEALYQFLWEDESRSLHHQFHELEESIVAQNATAVKQLAQQLGQIIPTIEQVTHPLTAQLEQLQTQVEALKQQLSHGPQNLAFITPLENEAIELESPIEIIEVVHATGTVNGRERDPFLDRLSALLEDF